MPRCPYCSTPNLIYKGQCWSFDNPAKDEVISVDFDCDQCGKTSNWVFVNEDGKERLRSNNATNAS